MPRQSKLLAALMGAACLVAQQRSAEDWSNEGARMARAGQIDAAIQAYSKALQLNPRLAPVYLNLGIAYFRAGRHAEAEKHFRTFLEQQGDHQQARHLLGLCLFEQQRYGESAQELEQVRRASPTDVSVLLPLAAAWLRAGRPEPARQALQTLLEQRGDSAEVHLVLGIGYAQNNENQKAIEEFEMARRRNPKLPWVYKWMAETLVKLNREPEALPLYRKELEINPNDAEANYELGAIFERRGEDAQAEKLLSAALRARPAYGDACYTLGKLYQRQGNVQSALPLLENAVKLLPDNHSAHYQLGRLYQRLGRPQDARAQFRITEQLQQARRDKARQAISPQ